MSQASQGPPDSQAAVPAPPPAGRGPDGRAERDRWIADRYGEGLSMDAIAQRLGISDQTVSKRLKEMGVESRRKGSWWGPEAASKRAKLRHEVGPLWLLGRYQSEIAEQTARSQTAVSKIVEDERRAGTLDAGIARNREIVRRALRGEPHEDIARGEGLALEAVRRIVSQPNRWFAPRKDGTPAMTWLIAEAHRRGASDKLISACLQLSLTSVRINLARARKAKA